MKTINKILTKIRDLRYQRTESERETKEDGENSKFTEGWEDGYDDALDMMEEIIEDLK